MDWLSASIEYVLEINKPGIILLFIIFSIVIDALPFAMVLLTTL